VVDTVPSHSYPQAAALGSILSEAGAPRVGACVAAARFLHHTVCAMKSMKERKRNQIKGMTDEGLVTLSPKNL